MTDKKNVLWEEEPLVPYPFVARLIREIVDLSGLTYENLADKLGDKLDGAEATLSGVMIGQYISGTRTMSQNRMGRIAQAAKESGWATPAVEEALLWNRLFEIDEVDEAQVVLKEEKKKSNRSDGLKLKKLESVITDLIQEEWTDGEIVALAILLAEKYIPEHKRTGGGLIDVGRIRSLISANPTGERVDHQWLKWSFKNRIEN